MSTDRDHLAESDLATLRRIAENPGGPGWINRRPRPVRMRGEPEEAYAVRLAKSAEWWANYAGNPERNRDVSTDDARPLSFDAYQAAAHDTAIYPGKNAIIEPYLNGWGIDPTGEEAAALLYLVPALCGEAGEVAQKFAKIQRDKSGIFARRDILAIGKELGGLQWMIAEIATLLGLSLGDIAAENLAVLASRAERGVLGGNGDER